MGTAVLYSFQTRREVSAQRNGCSTPIPPQFCGNKPAKFGSPDPDGLANFLRARHPRDTADCVSKETDIPARTVERWLSRDVLPRLPHFFALVTAYGPDVIAATVGHPFPLWLDTAVTEHTREKLTQQMSSLQAQLEEIEGGAA